MNDDEYLWSQTQKPTWSAPLSWLKDKVDSWPQTPILKLATPLKQRSTPICTLSHLFSLGQ